MKRFSTLWETLLIVAIVVLASICAQSQAQEAEEGKVVTISQNAEADAIEPLAKIAAEPTYWIGIRGRSIESTVLRTHLQLAEDMGVVVEDVVADSPAAKAGLRKYDIILRANGDAVDNMQVLQSQVRTGKEKPLELKIVRLGKQEKIVVVPERFERVTESPQFPGQVDHGVDGDLVQLMLDGGGMEGLMNQLRARNIGPGMIFQGGGQRFDLNQMPNGVSVSIQRNNNEPPQITVKQGDKTWQVEGDDEESLEQLPDDVRPFVERMLNRQNNAQGFGGAFGKRFGGDIDFGELGAELQEFLPRDLGDFRGLGEQRLRRQRDPGPGQAKQRDEMQQRMERLEKRLIELQEKFNNEGPALLNDKTS